MESPCYAAPLLLAGIIMHVELADGVVVDSVDTAIVCESLEHGLEVGCRRSECFAHFLVTIALGPAVIVCPREPRTSIVFELGPEVREQRGDPSVRCRFCCHSRAKQRLGRDVTVWSHACELCLRVL